MNAKIQESLKQVAINKAISAKEFKAASAELEPGTYAVDMSVQIRGTINKGEAFEQRISNKVDWILLFALMASKVNNETLDAVMREYEAAEADKILGEKAKEIKLRVQAHVDTQKGKTLTLKSGNVKSALTVKITRVKNGEVSQIA